MDTDDINYKKLRKIQQLEKTSSSLTKINNDFYFKLSDYLKNLEKITKAENDPNRKKLFYDEIENTKKIALNIYELREKKLVQSALSKVRGGNPDIKNVINLEKKLFETLSQQINNFRKNILEKQSNQVEDSKVLRDKLNKNMRTDNKKTIVRVLENIPEFIGTDMKTYRLRKNDVITVSNEMFAPLDKRGVVKEIK
jgi:DNA replication initiation complex subunit (GINS family)